MPPRDFTRPRDGFRFRFGGMKLNTRPDALPQDKYAIAINVREYESGTVQTRPGLATLFSASGGHGMFTDVRGYAALNTNQLTRFLARDADDTIWLDNGSSVGSLAGSGVGPGAAMIPFRPSESPNPYMYIANGSDYQKFSAPAANVVTQQKVGISEPTAIAAGILEPSGAPDAWELPLLASAVSLPTTPAWTLGGTAGTILTANRVSDVAGAVLRDPNVGASFSVQVSVTTQYARLMAVTIAGAGNVYQVQDVFPQSTTNIGILGITYFSGTTGRCVIVPNNLAPGPTNVGKSLYDPSNLMSVRRGSLLQFQGGASTEIVYVLSVVSGPDGTVAIEVSATANHTSAETFKILPAIAVSQLIGSHTPTTADTILEIMIAYAVTTGIGTATTTATVSNLFVSGGAAFQEDDYISFGMVLDNPANLLECKVLFDINDGSFTKDFLYYTIRPSDLAAAIANTATQISAIQTLEQRATIDEEKAAAAKNQGVAFSSAQFAPGGGQWAQFFVPLRELTRVGNTQGLNLQNLQKIQFLWNASGALSIAHDSTIYVAGGSQPDTGEVGAPYRYRIRGKSSLTGVVGNPSPPTRYGLTLRRQSANVRLPDFIIDSVDTWEVFRYGGSVTSWRYIASAPAVFGTSLTDNFSDDEALGGDELEFDNFEPWPSVDVPFQNTNAKVNGTLITFSTTTPGNLARFLPGNLIQVGSKNVYTLRCRPTNVSGNNWLMQLEETAGFISGATVSIYEPEIAQQFLPYMWGPDANGNVFACGDPLRAGTLYFCKPYAPDSAPDSYNQEIVQPSEPLLGGEIVDGVSYAATSLRWWRLYFQPENPAQRFSAVQEPIDRGLAAPYGHCTDNKQIFFWAEDGINGTALGSLTDADLYDLFPHEGVLGKDIIYHGIEVTAPDYTRVGSFRLAYAHGFLYATYLAVSTGNAYQMLVLNLHTMAWCRDVYANTQGISVVYKEEQPPASGGVLNPALVMAGTISNVSSLGRVFKQSDLTNDNGGAIGCSLAVREFDGGDSRAPKQWGDFFVDLIPSATAGVSVTPMSLGVGLTLPIVIAQNLLRVRQAISMGNNPIVSDFVGLFLTWTDDFSLQLAPTQVFLWQPSFDIQPARSIAWQTFGSSFGLQGYGHIRQIAIAWVSTAQVTLTITTVDGQDPQVITLPSSGGVYTKQLFPVSANKGQLFIFQAGSSAPFQIFEDDIDIYVGQWGRNGPYQIAKSFGGMQDASGAI